RSRAPLRPRALPSTTLFRSEGRLAEAQQILDMLKRDEYLQFIRRDGGETSALATRAALSPEEAALDERYREISDSVASIGRERGDRKSTRLNSSHSQISYAV